MKLTKIKKWGCGVGFILLLGINAWSADQPVRSITMRFSSPIALSDEDKVVIKTNLMPSNTALPGGNKGNIVANSARAAKISPAVIYSIHGKPVLSVPDTKNMLSLNTDMPTHTDLIGSVNKPTIDGGIIHAADGLPVQTVETSTPEVNTVNVAPVSESKAHSAAVTIKSESKNNSTQTTVNNQHPSEVDTSSAFDDNWATNPHLSTDLQRAAKTGQLPLVLSEAKALNLPASVALVPLVESRYHNEALSPKGAGGAWQLMPETAKNYGLPAEARTDFNAATPAALALLANLHESFGNWTLAFAAYNAGPGRVQSALKANPEARSIDDLNLPKETKDYVHQLQSLSTTI